MNSAWAYDLWLKTSVWSFVPYMVSFGLVAPFLTYGLTPPQGPAGWAIVTMSLLGLAAHVANGIPDIDTDRATGSDGVVGRLGRSASGTLAVVALVAASAAIDQHDQAMDERRTQQLRDAHEQGRQAGLREALQGVDVPTRKACNHGFLEGMRVCQGGQL